MMIHPIGGGAWDSIKVSSILPDKTIDARARRMDHASGEFGMKTRLLFLGAILFFIFGKNAHEGFLFYFFSIHLFTLFIGVFFHRREIRLSAERNKEIPPPAESSKS